MDYEQLLRNVTVDEADKAFEVFKECLARGSSHEKALGCIWRMARITAKLSQRERQRNRMARDAGVPAFVEALGPIEPVEGGILDE